MPDTRDFEYDVFLSHNEKDKDRVRNLAQRLADAGLRVWLDDWVIKPGDDIYLAIERGLEASRVQVLCLSQAALDSTWVTMERNTVLFRDPSNAGRRFIPILLTDCKLPDSLKRFKYVDFRNANLDTFDELLASCRLEATSPSAPAGEIARKPTTTQKTEPIVVLEKELKGHTGWVKCVVVSPDGTWAVSGAHDKTLRVWDIKSARCRAVFSGHGEHVMCAAVLPNGDRILSGSRDRSVRLWDVHTLKEISALQIDGTPLSLCPFAHGERVLVGLAASMVGPAPSIGVWSLRTNTFSPMYKTPSYTNSVSVDQAENLAFSGDGDGTVRLWDIEAGKLLANWKGHSGPVNAVQITADARLGVSGSDDKIVKIWDLKTRRCIGRLEGHRSPVHGVAISPDRTFIASVGSDESLRLWDFGSGECLLELSINGRGACATFSPDGSRLLVGMIEGPILVFRVERAVKRESQTSRRYVNAKVVLLGEGTVGKTSLACRLIQDKYVVRDRTHGMNVWPLQLPPAGNSTTEREALLWDLAGQEDYRLIHRLFLDETALALLLINPQTEDPFVEAGDWLKALDTAASNQDSQLRAARLLIFSQIDVGGMKLSNTKIKRFQEENGFAAWLPTSAKTGENCSDSKNGSNPSRLKQLIADTIPWDKLPWTATPRLLAELKSAVMTMRDTADIRLVRFAELVQRLEQALKEERFEEADVRTAVTLLANHGLARSLKFGDLVLLQPELMNGYASAIIRAARAHTDEIGSVPEAAIYGPDFDFTGVERLANRPDEELLLRAMVQTFLDNSLCIAEETPEGRHLVFPSQYRREKDIPHEPAVFVSYTFHGEWQTVWTTLVVRLWYSQEFKHKELWRNAAEFISNKRHALGLKIANRQGEGEATISVYFEPQVPDELKVIFIEYVHRHLERYARDVTRERRYICHACARPVKDLDAVRRRITSGKSFVTCQECDERVELVDFVEQQLKTDPVARKILAMEETATRVLDTQALEQILIGHVQAIAGEANQIFRELDKFDYGIDGEIEFKDNDGRASGKKIYVQLKSGNSYLRTRKSDGREIFDVKNERHLEYWQSQPVDVYLVIRQTEEKTDAQTIRWMNVTHYLKDRKNKESRQIVFEGDRLTMEAVWKTRDEFFPPRRERAPTSPA